MYKKYVKRLLDVILSILAIVILSPVIIVIAVLVRIKMGSPILFAQERIGKDEKIFNLYKFRSMTNESDESGKLLDESMRLTPFGIALRSTSLDELPELFMILKGEMSLLDQDLNQNITDRITQIENVLLIQSEVVCFLLIACVRSHNAVGKLS